MKKFLDHNAAFLMACIWASLSLVWFYGCQSSVLSLDKPGVKVTRTELQGEIDAFVATANARITSLNEQDAMRQKISKGLSLLAQGGTINTTGVINLALGILGIGAVATYRKKDSVIKTLKNNNRNADQANAAKPRVTPSDS